MVAGGSPVVALVVAVVAVLAALQPSEFHITRSTTIAAPAAAEFAQVNDFHNWDAWSGNGKVGEGRMTITESRPHELVRIRLEFVRPFAATNTAEFAFKPEGGRTAVTWSMYGHNNFVGRAIFLFVNMDKTAAKS